MLFQHHLKVTVAQPCLLGKTLTFSREVVCADLGQASLKRETIATSTPIECMSPLQSRAYGKHMWARRFPLRNVFYEKG